MGYAIATEAQSMGAEVTLISGPVSLEKPNKIKLIEVETSAQMYNQVKEVSANDIRPFHQQLLQTMSPRIYLKASIKIKMGILR